MARALSVVASFSAAMHWMGTVIRFAARVRAARRSGLRSQFRAPGACTRTAANRGLRLAARVVTIPPKDHPMMAMRFGSIREPGSPVTWSTAFRRSSASASRRAMKRWPRSAPTSSVNVGPSDLPYPRRSGTSTA